MVTEFFLSLVFIDVRGLWWECVFRRSAGTTALHVVTLTAGWSWIRESGVGMTVVWWDIYQRIAKWSLSHRKGN